MNYSIKKALSYRIRLHHNPRAFQKAQVYVTTNTLAKSYNLSLSDVLQPEFVHISDVVAYSIEDVST
jgi:hypothetical protein